MNSQDETQEAVVVPTHIRVTLNWGAVPESVWATETDQEYVYTIANIPIQDAGINWGDLVYVTPGTADSLPIVKRVVQYSGNRTLPILLVQAYAHQVLKAIRECGYDFELFSSAKRVTSVSINIPPAKPLHDLYAVLIDNRTSRYVVDCGWLGFGEDDES